MTQNNNNKPQDEKKEQPFEEKTVTLKESEYKELMERNLRIQADYENMRKRLERDKEDFLKFANEDLLFNLLNVVDDLERSLQLAQEKHEDFTAFLKGVEMILAHLYDLLKKYGVLPIEAQGKLFDPHFHEALMQAEQADMPENTVVEELQKGYFYRDRVIRTAKVKVSKK